MTRRPPYRRSHAAGLALAFAIAASALAGGALATARSAHAALSDGCALFHANFFGAGALLPGVWQFQAGERITAEAGPPTAGTPTQIRLTGTDPLGHPIDVSTGFPGMLVYDLPLTGGYANLLVRVNSGTSATWHLNCGLTPPKPAPPGPPRELPGKPAADPTVQADVAVTQTMSESPRVGVPATLTMSATNNGGKTATDTFVKDTMPAGFEYIACALKDAGGKSIGSCSWDGENTVVANIGALKAGETATFTIGVRPTKAGSFVNTVGIGADQWDPNSKNNFVDLPITVAA